MPRRRSRSWAPPTATTDHSCGLGSPVRAAGTGRTRRTGAAFGEAHGLPEYSNRKVECDDMRAWEFAAVAAAWRQRHLSWTGVGNRLRVDDLWRRDPVPGLRPPRRDIPWTRPWSLPPRALARAIRCAARAARRPGEPRCAASPRPSWAIWNAPAPCCGARPARPPGAGAGAGALRAGRGRCGAGDARPDRPDETLESTRQVPAAAWRPGHAAHARLLHARRLLLLAGPTTPPSPSPAGTRRAARRRAGGACLAAAGIALRRLQAEPARPALAQARTARAHPARLPQARPTRFPVYLRPRRPG